MQITAIKKKNTRKYAFDIDGHYAFFLTPEELRQFGLYETVSLLGEEGGEELDVPLSDENYNIIIRENVIPRGKKYALGLLADREYSERGISDKLLQTGYCEKDKDEIVSYLKESGFLSDDRFAEGYIRLRIASKSKRYIEQKLMSKGISSECIKNAFDTIEDELAEAGSGSELMCREAIMKVLRSKLKISDAEDKDKQTAVIRKLLRQGYRYSDINEAILDFFSAI